MAKEIFLLIFSISVFCCFSQQNLKENYTPIKSSGQLPAVFTQNVRDIISKDIEKLNQSNETDKKLKTTYIINTNYQIERIIRSGNVLLNDEITDYVNQVADIVLKDNPELRKQISIYTVKSPVVNAYSFDKGYIFINIGLLAQLESEAQLAFALCHEISHYLLKHQINGYIKDTKISKHDYDGKSYEDRLLEKCQFSKETESEADIEGLRLFELTNYSLKQVSKVFDVLQYSHLPFELVEVKKSFFESEGYSIPNSYFLKEVSPIHDNSNADDSKQTHPNTAKRKQNVAEIITNKNNAAKVNAIYGKEKFENMRDLARFELCRLYLKQRDFANAFYAAYILNQKYPANEYLAEVISKCIYAIALYKNDYLEYNKGSYLKEGIPESSSIEGYPQQLYYLIQTMPKNEWAFMALNYVYRQHQKHPGNINISKFSDSLFKLVEKVDWGISNFSRVTPQKQKELIEQAKKDSLAEPVSKTDLIANAPRVINNKPEDSIYYKNIYADLFMTDENFGRKFPLRNTFNDVVVKKTNKEFNKNRDRNHVVINKVLLLEPFYIKVDLTRKEKFNFINSDKKQENFISVINYCAKLQQFELITIDPGLMETGEVGKINDYSIINDWLEEKLDSDRDKVFIFNTNEIDNIVSKYGTQYILKTGLITVKKTFIKNTYFYSVLFDIKENVLLYNQYERFSKKDKNDLVNAKTYQMIYKLKTSKNLHIKKQDEIR